MSNPFVLGTHKFETLDALRGIAALAVVEYHATALSAHAFRHGYLAVDFFFVLSGFVLSYAYGDRLAEGWSTASFMKARFIRLWPLNTLGLLLGLLLGVAHHPLDAALLRTILLNLIFLPSRLLPHGSWFPVNPVAWTLFFELFSNLFHVLFLRRARSGVLIAVVCLSGAVYAQRILVAGSADIGINVAAIDGFAR
ncbi:MAG TPA: acyltransferase family protein, partial [Acidobacteriaceae bacterium]|nr:acyltransferase family protein [Acidobacteriaceae bacterium]